MKGYPKMGRTRSRKRNEAYGKTKFGSSWVFYIECPNGFFNYGEVDIAVPEFYPTIELANRWALKALKSPIIERSIFNDIKIRIVGISFISIARINSINSSELQRGNPVKNRNTMPDCVGVVAKEYMLED